MRSPLLALLALTACQSSPRPGPEAKIDRPAPGASTVALDPDDPTTCEACHGTVVKEFRESLHSRAHHAVDPLYGAMRQRRLEKQGPEVVKRCAVCHTPRDQVDVESPSARAGVTCATCHQLAGVTRDGGAGVHALVAGPQKHFRGPHDVATRIEGVHGTGPALAELVDGTTLCLACHAEERNTAGLLTCSTGPEYDAAGAGPTCTSCHMKTVDGPSGTVTTRPSHRSHSFAGPDQHRRLGGVGLMDEAVNLSGRFTGERLEVTIENRSPHAFPTGFPARMALLDVRGLDASGQEVFHNVTTDPMKEHPEAVFNRGFVDAEGKPSLAPFATRQVRDNRLGPKERRLIALTVPATVTSAELRVKFFLLAPFAAQQLAYRGPETAPLVLPATRVAR
jgi:hypothetical protein